MQLLRKDTCFLPQKNGFGTTVLSSCGTVSTISIADSLHLNSFFRLAPQTASL